MFCVEHLGFTSYLADPDGWMTLATKSSCQEHYEHLFLYTDDNLVVSDEAEEIIRNQIWKHVVVKKGSIGLPNRHLGGRVRNVLLENMAGA